MANQEIYTGTGSARKLAILIDADNAQAGKIEAILAEVASLGEAVVKRIYGDFTSQHSSGWKKVLNKFAIKPVQQFAYTTGKNATDSSLIIDAMDLLHKGKLDGFCLVSSDSDFTGLATRIREEGLVVYGFGEEKTPASFRNACNKFILTEYLKPEPEMEEAAVSEESEAPTPAISARSAKSVPSQKKASKKKESVSAQETKQQQKKKTPIALIKKAIEINDDDAGWVDLGQLGNYLSKVQPDFDPRSYGFKKLTDLITSHAQYFELENRAKPNSPTRIIYVRLKKAK